MVSPSTGAPGRWPGLAGRLFFPRPGGPRPAVPSTGRSSRGASAAARRCPAESLVCV